jgi:hypothetical protein
MSDDAPVGGAGAGAPGAHIADDAVHHHDAPLPVAPSRRSTWTKSIADVHVSGTQTPMSQMNRLSRIEPGIEDYFVSFSRLSIGNVDAN